MASPSENTMLPANPTVQDWQQAVDNWIKTVGVRYFDPLTNTAVLMEEVGELRGLWPVCMVNKVLKSQKKSSNGRPKWPMN